jgi:Photosynthetic reaction centre cytochrome C subunit
MKLTILKLAAFGLLITASVTIFIERGAARGTRSQNTSAATAPQEQTVEQAEKNIKVLTGMPQSQLIPVMNYFAASMGRRCNFCHVNKNGQWDYASDEKPEKSTSREMIKMVLAVNKDTFKGNVTVSCYTCHRGRNNPQSVPTLPLPLPSPPAGNQGGPRPGPGEGGQTPPAGQPQASPSARPTPIPADDIINKYIAAIGGQEAIDKIKTRVMKGNIVGATGQQLSYEIDQSASNKAYEMFKSDRGMMERAVNGETGWEKNPQGVRDLAGQQLADLKISLQLFRNLKLKEQYPTLRVAGRDKVNDRDAYVVAATTADKKRERLYFDMETGLLVRRITITQTMIGIIPEQTDFEDYRDVDGVKLPFTIRVSSVDPGNPISTRKFDEIKLNVPVEDSKFGKPPAAKPATP